MCKLQLRGRITLRPGENQSCRVRVRVRVRGRIRVRGRVRISGGDSGSNDWAGQEESICPGRPPP